MPRLYCGQAAVDTLLISSPVRSDFLVVARSGERPADIALVYGIELGALMAGRPHSCRLILEDADNRPLLSPIEIDFELPHPAVHEQRVVFVVQGLGTRKSDAHHWALSVDGRRERVALLHTPPVTTRLTPA